ncbi:hypothetical protein [Bacillus sp. FSL L8-0152]|uniref:hypothetical protein n=1 Tax=Bacillus sp. FSL L8-0152 TaxID=2921516 RepID=UPI0030FD0383
MLERKNQADKLKDQVIVITRIEDFDNIQNAGKVKLWLPTGDDSDRDQAQRIEARIERNAVACGCTEGSIAGAVYIFAITLLALAGLIRLSTAWAWAAAVGGLFVVLLAGKMFGLTLAKIRLSLALREAKQLIDDIPKEGSHYGFRP